ncbi:hypothetical protein [Coleofasciculus sp. E2-BRE-01]|uniref:hypothetical protein n=1 Tax=unclassified Coleofasciculus TaxID=2692782 RepID=UPI0032F81279
MIQLGLWQGFYRESDRVWLRWYDTDGDWVLTPEERERRQVERLTQQNIQLIECL